MGKFLSYLAPAAIVLGIGVAALAVVINHAAGQATAVALGGGVFTIALAVYIQE